MKRPKKLYRFGMDMNIEVHVLTRNCAPQVVSEKQGIGVLWRCRHTLAEWPTYGDHYGYENRKTAKAEEIQTTRTRIAELKSWLNKLEGTCQ